MEESTVRLPPGTKKRIAALVGTYRMAEFIREAVEAELSRREAAQPGAEAKAQRAGQ